MNSKTDKENRSCDDIAFLFEIITNFRFWQVKCEIGYELHLIQNLIKITTFR